MFRNFLMMLSFCMAAIFTWNVTTANAATEYESNNSISAATPISLGNNTVTVDGTLSNSSDDDYFSFTLTKPGKVVVNINNNLNTRYRVGLYNAQQDQLEEYATEYNVDKGASTLFSQGLDAGTYYIKVDYYDGNGNNVPYKLKLDYSQSDNYEKEFNNDRSSANMISLNKKYEGWADRTSDYFVFEIPSNGELKVDLKKSRTTRYNVTLYNSAGDEMEDWYTYYGTGSMSNIIHTGLPQGTYYVRVVTYDGDRYNIPYELAVNFKANSFFETENNDSTSEADALTLNKVINGVISYSGDADYYILDTSKNMNLALYLTTPKDTGFYVRIFNQDESVDQELYTKYGNGRLTNISNLNLKKGIYYIKVRRDKGEDNKIAYTLKVAQRDSNPPVIPTVNKVTTKSTAVTGKGEKGATIYVYRGSKKIGQAIVSSTGAYSVKIQKQKKGTSLKVYAKDKAGNNSRGKIVKVQ